MSEKKLIDAVMLSPALDGHTQEDVLKMILQLTDSELRLEANQHGDVALADVTRCSCLDKLRRICAVNATVGAQDAAFKEFKERLFGDRDGHSPKRRVARRPR